MSVANNNIKRNVARKSVFPEAAALTDVTVSYNQGDVLVLKAGLIQKATAEADSANSLGVAVVTVVTGKLKSPYQGTAVDAAQAPGSIPGPAYGVEAEFALEVGDAFAPGDLVYLAVATDPQTITVTAGTSSPLGYYTGRVVASAVAGDKDTVHVGAQIDGQLQL